MTYSKQNKTKKKDVVERAIRGQNSSHIPFVSHHHHHWNLERYYVKLGKKKGNVLGGKFEKFFKGGICASYTGTQNSSSLPFFFLYYAPTVQCIIADRRARKHTKKKTHFLKKLIPVLQEKKIIQNWQDKISFVCVCVYTIVSRCPSPHLLFYYSFEILFVYCIIVGKHISWSSGIIKYKYNIDSHTHSRRKKLYM